MLKIECSVIRQRAKAVDIRSDMNNSVNPLNVMTACVQNGPLKNKIHFGSGNFQWAEEDRLVIGDVDRMSLKENQYKLHNQTNCVTARAIPLVVDGSRTDRYSGASQRRSIRFNDKKEMSSLLLPIFIKNSRQRKVKSIFRFMSKYFFTFRLR